MKSIRFIMVGGFLGGGKTTTIGRLARMLTAQGRRVGIVTNDQAADLVDTHLLRSQGHHVGEVAGACFCCHFNDLIATVENLEAEAAPDVILAEPVGSCTDLVATVVQPLLQLYEGRFEVAPYGVILKPSHGLRILRPGGRSGFSPKAAYIFRKQLEEADFVLLNRIDELSAAEADELAALVAAEFPDTPQRRISAKTGDGFDALVEYLDQQGSFGRRILEIDYDTYAEGEAELGWLNARVTLASPEPFDVDRLVLDVITHLHAALAAAEAETAHLKVIGMADDAFAVANLVSSESRPELSLPSYSQTRSAELIVNARVALDPAQLEQRVRTAVESVCRPAGIEPTWHETASFRPGRPVPTHRLAAK
ncbi:MAG: cobalamin biosynthesis protein P47K [Planctomycetota bacterium]|nr:MAG: cobalamin biosynthesis protein P47K [Planctomycetota bacterium]